MLPSLSSVPAQSTASTKTTARTRDHADLGFWVWGFFHSLIEDGCLTEFLVTVH